jgi:hypothetical protein
LWNHQKSQETNNEALDNEYSQTKRKTSLYSGNKNGRIGHFRGGSDKWRQTPMPAPQSVPPPSQRKRAAHMQEQPPWLQRDAGLIMGGSMDSGSGSGLGLGLGGPEISVINDGMMLCGDDGNPFSQYDNVNVAAVATGTTLYDPAGRGVVGGVGGGSPRLNGAIARAGANVLGENERRRQKQLVQNLPDQQTNMHPPLACRADLDFHRASNVKKVRQGGRKQGGGSGGNHNKSKNNKRGPRVRRKNPGPKKELPSYMRPTAAMTQWTKQTADVKKMPKQMRKKQIY